VDTVNCVEPEDIVAAARLVKKGKMFALGMNFDGNGPQSGANGRINPLHFMTATGTDSMTGVQLKYSGAAPCHHQCDRFPAEPVHNQVIWMRIMLLKNPAVVGFFFTSDICRHMDADIEYLFPKCIW
jgi:hypothetical protein